MFRSSAIHAACAALSLSLAPVATAQVVTWNQRTPATSLPPLDAPASTYDPVSGTMLVFGGYDGFQQVADTWAFDGSTWTKLSPSTSPPARAAGTMAYDSVTKTVLLFGGFDGHNYLGDTWIFDGSTSNWTQASPTVVPPGVTGAMAFTDPKNGHVSVFGGFDGSNYYDSTYRWTGTDWRRLRPAHSAWGRAAGLVGFDPVLNQVVLFGGIGHLNPDNTWTWDGSDWTEMSPATQPPLRFSSAAAFEPHVGAVIVFGGSDGAGPLNDTWKWTGSDWVALSPIASPPAREGLAMAFDAAIDRIVIAAGSDKGTLLSDTWDLLDEGEFVDVGPGIGGSLGPPTLSGSGDLSAGSPAGFTLTIGNALPTTPTLLLASLSNAAMPFKDGTLYPFPTFAIIPLVTDPGGAASLAGAIPAGTPSGTTIYLQAWLADASAPKRASGTNGLAAIVP